MTEPALGSRFTKEAATKCRSVGRLCSPPHSDAFSSRIKPQRPNQFVIYAIGRGILNWLKGGGGGKLLAGLALAVLIGVGSLFTKRKSDGGAS